MQGIICSFVQSYLNICNTILVALNTRNESIMCRTLKALQQLVRSGEYIGQALIPYYRQLLPVFNIFKGKNSESFCIK